MGTALATLSLASLAAGLALDFFGPAKRLTFEMEGYTSLAVADLDGDRSSDVVSASPRDKKILWIKNNGGASFSSEFEIASQVHPTWRSIKTADMDNDGDLDVLATLYDSTNPLSTQSEYKVVWYEKGRGAEDWTEHLVSVSTDRVKSVVPIDLNGDTWVDLVSVSESVSGGMLLEWRAGAGDGTFGTKILLDSSPAYANQVCAADLDGDNDQDLVVSFDLDGFEADSIRWYENLGSGNFASNQLISFGVGNVNDFVVEDFLGDSLPDVLLVGDELGLVAIENLGGPGFPPHSVVAPDPGLGHFSSVVLSDVDGDSDLDILVGAANTSARVYCFENQGDGGFLPQRPLTENLFGHVDVAAGDLDGDGDPEALAASEPFFPGVTGGRILWFENFVGPFEEP
ncbi:MAG: FG-GAP repeat domain-containing protein [Planctomycetota bacterium]